MTNGINFEQVVEKFREFLMEVGINRKNLMFIFENDRDNVKTEFEMKEEWNQIIEQNYMWLEFRPYSITENSLFVHISFGERATISLKDRGFGPTVKFYGMYRM
jgi:hypothetical protein